MAEIDLEELAAIIELLDRTEFTQFQFEKGDLRVAVTRDGAPLPGSATPTPTPAPRPEPSAPAAPPVAAPAPAPSMSPSSSTDLAADEILVRSPMLGTFYRSPKPGEAPFVEEGSVVESDSVLCIIEVMKLMNSVTAEVAGEVRRVLVADGALVEYDQPLFVVGRSA